MQKQVHSNFEFGLNILFTRIQKMIIIIMHYIEVCLLTKTCPSDKPPKCWSVGQKSVLAAKDREAAKVVPQVFCPDVTPSTTIAEVSFAMRATHVITALSFLYENLQRIQINHKSKKLNVRHSLQLSV